MSRVCELCGKKPVTGYKISHANNKTKIRWYPNLQKVNNVGNGRVSKIKVCTRCIKAGRISKP